MMKQPSARSSKPQWRPSRRDRFIASADITTQRERLSRSRCIMRECHVYSSLTMALITSPSNPRITKLKDLYTVRGRKQSRLFLMEGLHLLEALLDAQLLPHEVYYQPALLQRTTK